MTRPKAKRKKKMIPVDAVRDMLRGFHMELQPHGRGLSVTAHGAGHILSFSEHEVELRCGARTVRLRGEELALSVFEDRAAQITGRIKEIVLV